MRVYVVNLQRSIQRRRFMAQQLTKFGVDFEFVTARDAQVDPGVATAMTDGRSARGGVMSAGEIACALSHGDACRAASNRPSDELCVIMEDDVVIGRHFPIVLRHLEAGANRGDVTLLTALVFRPTNLEPERPIHGPYSMVCASPLCNIWGTQAYAVFPDAARKLASVMGEATFRADDWDAYQRGGFIGQPRLVFPFVALHAEFNSDVRHQRLHDSPMTRRFVSSLVHQYRIFPLVQIALWRRRRHAEKRQVRNLTVHGRPANQTFVL